MSVHPSHRRGGGVTQQKWKKKLVQTTHLSGKKKRPTRRNFRFREGWGQCSGAAASRRGLGRRIGGWQCPGVPKTWYKLQLKDQKRWPLGPRRPLKWRKCCTGRFYETPCDVSTSVARQALRLLPSRKLFPEQKKTRWGNCISVQFASLRILCHMWTGNFSDWHFGLCHFGRVFVYFVIFSSRTNDGFIWHDTLTDSRKNVVLQIRRITVTLDIHKCPANFKLIEWENSKTKNIKPKGAIMVKPHSWANRWSGKTRINISVLDSRTNGRRSAGNWTL